VFSLHSITNSLHSWLKTVLSPAGVLIVESLVVIVLAIGCVCGPGISAGMAGTKSGSSYANPPWPQSPWPAGIFQTSADTLKLILKEGLTHRRSRQVLIQPRSFCGMIVAMLLLAPMAFAKGFQIWDINIGVLFVSAVSSPFR
jgi:NADH-quinone oxidoreductase subunit H